MSAPSTILSQQQLIEGAKAPILAFNEKDWDGVRAGVARDLIYDEVATGRRVEGIDQVLSVWQGWATAFPDSRATIHNAVAAENTVVLELSWKGTHQGPLQIPEGSLAPTGHGIDVRACFVVEMAGDKVQRERHYFDMATLMLQLGGAAPE
ncbi:MAG TPA: ester cyclase [Gemmatimonadales bacterium]